MKDDPTIKLLSDPDPEVRRKAFDELAYEISDEHVRDILTLVESDASDEIRGDAVIALGPVVEECGDEYFDGAESDLDLSLGVDLGPPLSREGYSELVKRVRAVYEDPSQPKLVRRRAFETLVRDPAEWHREEIRKHFKSSDPEWKLTAVFAMGNVPGFDSELEQVVGEAEGELLAEAIRSAGEMEVEVGERVRELAASPATDRDVRLEAIRALPHVDPNSHELLDTLSSSEDEEVAAVAEEALDELALYGGGE
jgi:HEAT repeat protein